MPRNLRRKPRLDYWQLHRCGHQISKDLSDSESGTSNQLLGSTSPTISESERSNQLLLASISTSSPAVEDISSKISNLNLSDKMTRVLEDIQDELNVLQEDIADYLEENSIEVSVLSIEDLDNNINHAEKLRTNFRKLNVQLERIADRSDEDTINYNNTISRLKEFIGDLKNQKSSQRRKEVTDQLVENEGRIQRERDQLNQSVISSRFLLEEIATLTCEIYDEFSKSKVLMMKFLNEKNNFLYP